MTAPLDSERGPFFVFGGDKFYPSGGMAEYLGVDVSFPDAQARAGSEDWASIAVFDHGNLVEIARRDYTEPWQYRVEGETWPR